MEEEIRFLVMDVDGTLTDGKIFMTHSGELLKVFDVKDGYGIHKLLSSANIIPVVITGRKSEIVEQRCRELGIKEIYQGIQEKKDVLDWLLAKENCQYNKVAYIGDDLNDWSCMVAVREGKGLVGCPADASKEIIEMADFISSKSGGNGAVREFIEWIIKN